jgi:predicted O-methyltransferase YrrM
MIKKLFNNLLQPHKVPNKIFQKIQFYYKLKQFNQKNILDEQNSNFKSAGLEREKGIQNLETIKEKLDLTGSNFGLISEHEILLSSISIKNNHIIKNILEIGTYDGYNALILARLFPNSTIDTIDLPMNESCSLNNYNKNDKNFFRKRSNLLSKANNINFIQLNSIKLLNHQKKYDLIWVDGDHCYPTVCIDIVNSLKLINENGLILCDDVHINSKNINKDKLRYSADTYEILDILSKQNLINFDLIYKRLSFENISYENKKKFIAIVKKI